MNTISHADADTRTPHAIAPKRGRMSDAETLGLALRQQEEIELQENAEAANLDYSTSPGAGLMSEDERLANWYVGRDKQSDEAIATIKEQAARMIRAIEARRRGMIYAFGAKVKATIDRMLHSQGGKKKSVNLLTGRAGYRASPERLQIVDADRVLLWAEKCCPQAIKRSVSMSAINEHFKATGEIPDGVIHVESHENFYPPVSIYQLPDTSISLPEPRIS